MIPELELYGEYTIDLKNHRVSKEGLEVSLTHKQWLLFEVLFRHRGAPQSKTSLLAEVWGENADSLDLSTQTLEAHIYSLRQKLSPKMIVTLRNIGYTIPIHPPSHE